MTSYLLNISQVRKSQSKGGCSHSPSIPKRAPAIKLISCWLIHIFYLGGGELFQHLDHSRTITTARGGTVLLCKPTGLGKHGKTSLMLGLKSAEGVKNGVRCDRLPTWKPCPAHQILPDQGETGPRSVSWQCRRCIQGSLTNREYFSSNVASHHGEVN